MSYAIARYLNVRSANTPCFSSDSQRVIFLSDNTGVPQVWQVALNTNGDEPLWPDQLTFAADRVMTLAASRVPGDNRIIYGRDTGGDENAQLYLLDIGTASEICLTEGYEHVMHIAGEWSHDGKAFLFAANRRDPGLFDLYVQPLDGEARMVWQNDRPGFLFNLTFSPDGRRAAVVRMMGSFSTDLLEIDLSSGAARMLSPETEDARYLDIAYMPDGKSLLISTDLETDFLRIARVDLETRSLETLAAPEWDIDGLKISPDGRYLAYAVNVEGASALYLRDMSTGETRQADLGDVPGVVFVANDLNLAFSSDSKKIAFAYTSPTRTTDIFVWDLERDTIHPVTRSSHGGLPVESFVAPELVHYPTFDRDANGQTRQIPAWLYRPRQTQEPVPAIVVVHGGPESQSRPIFLFYIQYFLQMGYAVFVPNVRGSTGYGKAYSHLDDVEKRMDSVADLAHGARWLQQQPGIDGDRLVVYGGSYGGFMVLSAITTYPDLWVAAVDIVGISSFVTFLENTSAYRRAHREHEYGSLERDRAFLESISPINHIDKATAALMVIHGANDPRVPLSEAEQLAATLKSRQVPVELLVFDDEGHGVIKLKNKLVMYPAVAEFLLQHLAK